MLPSMRLMANREPLGPLSGWYAVRCLFESTWPAIEKAGPSHHYEERITLWRAESVDEAVALAEAEAEDYANAIERPLVATSVSRRAMHSQT